jgi:hypothetical protein
MRLNLALLLLHQVAREFEPAAAKHPVRSKARDAEHRGGARDVVTRLLQGFDQRIPRDRLHGSVDAFLQWPDPRERKRPRLPIRPEGFIRGREPTRRSSTYRLPERMIRREHTAFRIPVRDSTR